MGAGNLRDPDAEQTCWQSVYTGGGHRILLLFSRSLVHIVLSLAPLMLPLLPACSNGGEGPSPASTIDRGTGDDIREAVFRYQFEHNASGQQQSAPVYYLGFGPLAQLADPPEEFMARFEGNNPPVKQVSEIEIDAQEWTPGIIFRTDEITSISADEVEVEGGYSEAGFSASGNVYTVARRGGEWVVTRDRLEWIQ